VSIFLIYNKTQVTSLALLPAGETLIKDKENYKTLVCFHYQALP